MPHKEQDDGPLQAIGQDVQDLALPKDFQDEDKEEQASHQGVILVQSVENVEFVVDDLGLYLSVRGHYLKSMVDLVLFEGLEQFVWLRVIPGGNAGLQGSQIIGHGVPNEIGIEAVLYLELSPTVFHCRYP